MTIERPWALALLAVPVVLLWLRLRDARPREAEASSLLVWRRVAPADAAAARPRPPLAGWIEAAGAALIVLAIANPVADGVAPPFVRVLLDASPSMRGALPAARGAIGGSARIEETADIEGSLPGALAGSTPLVVVTDRRLPTFPEDPPRLRVVGVGQRGPNAGITAASGVPLPGGRWRLNLTLEVHGVAGPVEGTLSLGAGTERVTLAPGTPLQLVRDVAAPIRKAGIAFPGDRLTDDDGVALSAAGGALVRVLHPAALRDSPMLRALAAAGAETEESAGGERVLLLQVDEGSGGAPLSLRLPDGAMGDGAEIAGARVVASSHPLARDVKVDPASTLGRRDLVSGMIKVPETRTVGSSTVRYETVLADGDGPLASFCPAMGGGPAEVVLLFETGGTWVERDPSFVVFAKNLVDFAAGGPARIEATGLLDPAETRQAAEGESFGDLDEALAAAARPDVSAGYSAAPLLLGLAAAALALAWWLARG